MPLYGKENNVNSAPKFQVNDKGITGKTGFGTSVFLENGSWVYKYNLNGKVISEIIVSGISQNTDIITQTIMFDTIIMNNQRMTDNG